MKLFSCTDHNGMWPVPVASIAWPDTEDEARNLLMASLADAKVDPRVEFTLQEVDLSKPGAIVLSNGDY